MERANKLVAVIIPIYKPIPDVNELISLKQCLKELNSYPIIFIGPVKLDTSIYSKICDTVPFIYQPFEDYYFASINGYNQLMLSTAFYKTFICYKFILIYQLDAYVFKDELTYWCNKNYDFIGAPHIQHDNQPGEIQFLSGYSKLLDTFNAIFNTNHSISNVGNGGFSLRKTRTCYRLVYLLKGRIKKWAPHNEDGFFKYWGNLLCPFFKLPTDDMALRFSIEDSPAQSLKNLNGDLPFGCHAFEKREWETWKAVILNNN